MAHVWPEFLEGLSMKRVNRFLLRSRYERSLFDEVKSHINLIGGTLSGTIQLSISRIGGRLAINRLLWSGSHLSQRNSIVTRCTLYRLVEAKSVPISITPPTA